MRRSWGAQVCGCVDRQDRAMKVWVSGQQRTPRTGSVSHQRRSLRLVSDVQAASRLVLLGPDSLA
jgi:hypothetical protein